MKINEILTENKSSLFSDLKVMKPKFAQIAQSIYNRWSGKNYGSGICDEIAWRNAEYVNKKKFEIGAIALPHGRNKAGNHAYAVVFNKKEAFLIDIPYWKYETSKILKVKDHLGVKDLFWRKIPDVTFTYNDVRIIAIPRQKFMRWRDVVKTLGIVQKTHDSFKMIDEDIVSERIAPHGRLDQELKLMIDGKKPAWLTSKKSDMRAAAPYIKKLNWFVKKFVVKINSQGQLVPWIDYVITQKGEEWRADKIAALINDIWDHPENHLSMDQYHKELGALLGYDDKDIDFFINHQHERGYW